MIGINVQNVSFQYKGAGTPSLESISLVIPPGICLGLIGPNGAGKSTLLSILSGLLQPSSGAITFTQDKQEVVNQRHFIQENIALVPQEYAFYFPLSVMQNLEYFTSLCGYSSAQQKSAIQRVIQECQLESVLKQKSNSLSGGYKRRLNLAIALLKDPQVLYLDEPTVGVDPVSRKAILTLINTLKKQHKTIIFTSHMLSEIEEHCDDIYMLKGGQAFQFEKMHSNRLLKVTFTHTLAEAIQLKISGLAECQINQSNTLECQVPTDKTLWQIMQLLQQSEVGILSMQLGQSSLTEHYLKLMGSHDTAEH